MEEQIDLAENEIQDWVNSGPKGRTGDRLTELDTPDIQNVTTVLPEWSEAFADQGRRFVGLAPDPDAFDSEFSVVATQLEALHHQRALLLGANLGFLKLIERGADPGPTLFFLWSLTRRTGELARGFTDAVRTLNVTTAAGLPRQQVDNFLRAYVCSEEARTVQTETIASAVLAGTKLSDVVDPMAKPERKAKGKGMKKPPKLTDHRLKTHGTKWPWVDTIYSESSRWVHMSDRHSSVAYQFLDKGRFVGSLNTQADLVNESLLAEISWAMVQATTAVTDIVSAMTAQTIDSFRRPDPHVA